jgi:hypothetical protein
LVVSIQPLAISPRCRLLPSIKLTTTVPHPIAQSVEILTTVLTIAGMGYFIAALLAARVFLSARRAQLPDFTPGVSILKSLKGLDPSMIDAFRSHCRQAYSGEYELLFGVSSLDDPAATSWNFPPTRFNSSSVQQASARTAKSAPLSSSQSRRAIPTCSSTTRISAFLLAI